MLNICQFRYSVHLFPPNCCPRAAAELSVLNISWFSCSLISGWVWSVASRSMRLKGKNKKKKKKRKKERQKQREIGALTSQTPARLGLGAAEFSIEASIMRPLLMAAALQILVTMPPSPSSGLCGMAPGYFAIPSWCPWPWTHTCKASLY